MSPTPFSSFQQYALEQLGRGRPVTARRMFGGVGVYADGLFFALMDDAALWLKVDDTNRPDFEARGLGPFRPFEDRDEVMQYYPVPEDVLEDADALAAWVTKAVEVALRARATKAAKARTPPRPPRRPGR